MSTLATLQAVLKAELHMNSPYINGAIGDALRYVRTEELWFNQDKCYIDTVADLTEYELPDDFLQIRGDIWCTPSTQTDTRYRLSRRTVDEVEMAKYSASDFDYGYGGLTSGLPRICAIDSDGKSLLVAPVVQTSGDRLFFRYTKDLGTPLYSATVGSSAPPSAATVFTLLGPKGETLPSTFTNDWFTEGFTLVRAKAVHYLWTRYHGGTEEAMMKAQNAYSEYNDELRRLWGETSDKQSVVRVRGYL